MKSDLTWNHNTIAGLVFAVLFLVWMEHAEASTVFGVTIYNFSSELTLANSSYDRAAVYIVDGSGLDSLGQHTSFPDGTMWDANTFNPSLTTGTTDKAPSITFNLGYKYNLSSFRIWNFNSFGNSKGIPFTERSVESVDISTSNDGSAYTNLGTFQFSEAPGTGNYVGEVIPFNVSTQFVRFQILSNHANDLTFGVGLSEVQFSGSPVPIPAAIWLFGSALAGFGFFGKRRKIS